MISEMYEIIQERDQLKVERDTLIDNIEELRTNISRLEQIRDIKDSALKGADIKIKTLEQENNNLKQSVSEYKDYAESHVATYLEFRALEEENKVLRLQEKTYFDECQNAKKELKDYQDDYEMVTNNCIYWEDKAHWLEDESSKYIDLLSEISQHIGNKSSSSTCKYFREKLDELGIKEDEYGRDITERSK